MAVVLVTALVGLGIANYVFTSRIEQRYNRMIEHDIAHLHHLNLLGIELSNRQRYLLNLATLDDRAEIESFMARITAAHHRADVILNDCRGTPDASESRQDLIALEATLQIYNSLNADYIRLILENRTADALELNAQSMRPVYEKATGQMLAMAANTRSRTEQSSQRSGRSITRTRAILLLIALSPFLIWLTMLAWVFGFFGWCLLTSRGGSS